MHRHLFTVLILGVSPILLAWGARAAEDRPAGPRSEADGGRENPERRELQERLDKIRKEIAEHRTAGREPGSLGALFS